MSVAWKDCEMLTWKQNSLCWFLFQNNWKYVNKHHRNLFSNISICRVHGPQSFNLSGSLGQPQSLQSGLSTGNTQQPNVYVFKENKHIRLTFRENVNNVCVELNPSTISHLCPDLLHPGHRGLRHETICGHIHTYVATKSQINMYVFGLWEEKNLIPVQGDWFVPHLVGLQWPTMLLWNVFLSNITEHPNGIPPSLFCLMRTWPVTEQCCHKSYGSIFCNPDLKYL